MAIECACLAVSHGAVERRIADRYAVAIQSDRFPRPAVLVAAISIAARAASLRPGVEFGRG